MIFCFLSSLYALDVSPLSDVELVFFDWKTFNDCFYFTRDYCLSDLDLTLASGTCGENCPFLLDFPI